MLQSEWIIDSPLSLFPYCYFPAPEVLDINRPGALYNFNVFAYLDGDFLLKIARFIREGGKPSELPEKGWRPDLAKRGAIRTVFDGRYKLNRYFSLQEHHKPRSMEELDE